MLPDEQEETDAPEQFPPCRLLPPSPPPSPLALTLLKLAHQNERRRNTMRRRDKAATSGRPTIVRPAEAPKMIILRHPSDWLAGKRPTSDTIAQRPSAWPIIRPPACSAARSLGRSRVCATSGGRVSSGRAAGARAREKKGGASIRGQEEGAPIDLQREMNPTRTRILRPARSLAHPSSKGSGAATGAANKCAGKTIGCFFHFLPSRAAKHLKRSRARQAARVFADLPRHCCSQPVVQRLTGSAWSRANWGADSAWPGRAARPPASALPLRPGARAREEGEKDDKRV